MAKKVPISESKIKEEIKLTKQRKHKINILLIIAIVSIIGNGVLGVLLIFDKTGTNYEELYQSCDSKLTKLEFDSNELNDIVGDKTSYYIRNKLNFFDNNVVFVIEGFGDYYYSYDCMMQKVGNNQFRYWAYNREAAIDKGYHEGRCD